MITFGWNTSFLICCFKSGYLVGLFLLVDLPGLLDVHADLAWGCLEGLELCAQADLDDRAVAGGQQKLGAVLLIAGRDLVVDVHGRRRLAGVDVDALDRDVLLALGRYVRDLGKQLRHVVL